MHRSIVTTLGLALAFTSGCTLGEVGDDTTPIGDDDTTLPANALCESTLTLSGTFAAEAVPPPTEDQGCVPQGTWTVQVTVSDVGDCDEAPVSTSYIYTVTGEGADETVTFTGGAGELTWGIHAGGNGQCEGSFEHIWEATGGEFHVAQMSPYFAPGTTTMMGSGTYQLWSKHP